MATYHGTAPQLPNGRKLQIRASSLEVIGRLTHNKLHDRNEMRVLVPPVSFFQTIKKEPEPFF